MQPSSGHAMMSAMASLKQRLHDDLTAAMRAQDDVARATLRMALSAITKAEVAGRQQAVLTDDQVLALLRSEISRRVEAAAIFTANARPELAERERAEAAVLAPYLPPELSGEDLAAVVAEEVANAAQQGVTGPRATGAIIKAVRERVGQSAAGGRIAEAVKAALTPDA